MYPYRANRSGSDADQVVLSGLREPEPAERDNRDRRFSENYRQSSAELSEEPGPERTVLDQHGAPAEPLQTAPKARGVRVAGEF